MKNKKLLSVIGAFGLGISSMPFHTGVVNAQSQIEEVEQSDTFVSDSTVNLGSTYTNQIITNGKIIAWKSNQIVIHNESGGLVNTINVPVSALGVLDDGFVILSGTNLIKYDFTGNQLWSKPTNAHSDADSMVTYKNEIYVGNPYNDSQPVLKFDTNGDPQSFTLPPTTTVSQLNGDNYLFIDDNQLYITDRSMASYYNDTGYIVTYDLDSNQIVDDQSVSTGANYETILYVSKDYIISKSDSSYRIEFRTMTDYIWVNNLSDILGLSPTGGLYIKKGGLQRSGGIVVEEYGPDGTVKKEIELPPEIKDVKTITPNEDGTVNVLTSSGNLYKGLIQRPVAKYKGTNNLAVGVPVPNSLEMTMDTNTIDFTGYDGVSDTTNDTLSITVKSGLNYDLSATLTDEIRHSDGVTTMDKSHLRIKTSDDSDYKEFTDIGTPVTIVNNKQYGEHKHNINFKLIADSAVKAGDYEASVKFEVTQK